MFIEALALAMSSGRWVIHDDSLSLPVAKVFSVSRERLRPERKDGSTQMSCCHYEAEVPR